MVRGVCQPTAQARLELGVSKDEYGDILGQVGSALQVAESPSVADPALEALEMLVNAACPNIDERRQFAIQVVAIFQRWYKRVDRAQLALLKTLAEELGMAEATGALAKEIAGSQAASEWAQLEGKRIAMYSLQESALQRAALVVGELCPGIRIDTFSDHVGGSAALKKASTSADIFIIATGAAKVQSEVIEQRFGAVVLPHHDQQSSDDENPTEHGSDHFLLTCFRQISSR
jgi:hypothetical protein